MGNAPGGGNQFGPPKGGDDEKKPKKKKFEPRQASRVGKKRRKKGQASTTKLPKIRPQTKCRLRYLKLERMKDYLLIEEEFIRNQEVFKPKKEKDEEEREKVDDLRGSPMSIGNVDEILKHTNTTHTHTYIHTIHYTGTLEEMIDDNHAIVSSTHGPEYYVNILSFVDKDELQPSSTVLLHNKTNSVVGILGDNVDPMVSVMKVEKAPLESYSDIGGLETQIQEIKEVRRNCILVTHTQATSNFGLSTNYTMREP